MTTVHENIMHSQNYQSSMIPGLGLRLRSHFFKFKIHEHSQFCCDCESEWSVSQSVHYISFALYTYTPIPSYDTLWKHEIIHISILSPKCECRRHNTGGFPKIHVLPCTQSLTGELREKATQTDTTTQRERESPFDERRSAPQFTVCSFVVRRAGKFCVMFADGVARRAGGQCHRLKMK